MTKDELRRENDLLRADNERLRRAFDEMAERLDWLEGRLVALAQAPAPRRWWELWK